MVKKIINIIGKFQIFKSFRLTLGTSYLTFPGRNVFYKGDQRALVFRVGVDG